MKANELPESPSSSADAGSIMDRWSIEATLPRAEEIQRLAGRVRPGTEVFLSTLPHVSLDQQIEITRLVRASGLEPVPHVAVRYFTDRRALSTYFERIVGGASVESCLIIGGDLDSPRGEFASALSFIESGILSDFGIRRFRIAGYPEGHPKIPPAIVGQALEDKLDRARELGLEVGIVTQFCFDSGAIIGWIADIRKRWPEVPIRIGLAGPTSLKGLLAYAARCGVAAPRTGLAHKLSMAAQLVRTIAPDAVIRDIDAAYPSPTGNANLAAHIYSFGGLARTTDWVLDKAPEGAVPGKSCT